MSQRASGTNVTLVRVILTLVLTVLTVGGAIAYPIVEPLITKRFSWLEVEWRQWPFALLLIVVPLAWVWGTFLQDMLRPRLRVGTVLPLKRGPRGARSWLRDLPGVLRSVALMMVIGALCRPVAVLSDRASDEKGIDIVVVMDLSGSMRAVLDADPRDLPGDFELPTGRRPTRLDTAKIVVQDFISRRQTDRIGCVVFGKSAYILSPPTLDYQLLSHLVSRMSLSVIDGSATAIGDALGTAVARLRRSDALSKVVILLTDGDSNAGTVSPDYAIELANTVGTKVYTIQIGSGDEVDVQEGVDLFGQPRYVRRKFPVNPELLQRIAEKTGGEHFVATDAKALSDSMHSILDRLEKTRFEASVSSHEELFALFLVPGVVLIGLEALLRAWLLRRFP